MGIGTDDTVHASAFPGPRTRWALGLAISAILALCGIAATGLSWSLSSAYESEKQRVEDLYKTERARIDRIEARTDEIPSMQKDIGAINVKLDFLIDSEKRRQRLDDYERVK